MCGRFTLAQDIQTIAEAIMSPRTITVPASLQTVPPRYNIAPTQDVVTVMNNGSLHLDLLRWGLIPSWSKEENIGSRMINARAETLAEKPSFKRLLHSKRCLVVANGFAAPDKPIAVGMEKMPEALRGFVVPWPGR